eukprot:SAG22_NODE_574_length_8996_cov_12.163875_5_plen_460_part_00
MVSGCVWHVQPVNTRTASRALKRTPRNVQDAVQRHLIAQIVPQAATSSKLARKGARIVHPGSTVVTEAPPLDATGEKRAGVLRNQQGMVYPVALPGSWVGLGDPTTIQACDERACKGGNWSGSDGKGDKPNLNGAEQLYGDNTHKWLQTVSDCFLKPWVLMPKLGHAQFCPGTHTIGDDYTGQNFSIGRDPANHSCAGVTNDPRTVPGVHIVALEATIGAKDPTQRVESMPKCDAIIGNKCAAGYTGTGCATCCKDCSPDPDAERCFKSDQDDETCFTKHNKECAEKGNCGIVARNYYKPYTGPDKGTCKPCKSKPSWAVALAIGGGVLLGSPILAKMGKMLKSLQFKQIFSVPLLTLITFYQTLNLIQELKIEWPDGIRLFFKNISSWVSLLNFNIDVFHAECSLPMTFEQKWLLQVLSPFAFFIVTIPVLVGVALVSHCVRNVSAKFCICRNFKVSQ